MDTSAAAPAVPAFEVPTAAAPASDVSPLAAYSKPAQDYYSAAPYEEAKATWLAKLETGGPTEWGKAIADAAVDAAEVATLTVQCASGLDVACGTLSREAEAQATWMAKLDNGAWGPREGMVVPTAAREEQEAKERWLERRFS